MSYSIKINLPRVSAGFCLSPVHSPNAPTRPAGASVRPLLSSRPSRSVRSRSFIVVSIRAGMGLYFCNSRVRRSAQYKVTAKVTTAVTTITNHMRSRGTVLLRHIIGAKAAEPWAPLSEFVFDPPLRLAGDVTVRTLDAAAAFTRNYKTARQPMNAEYAKMWPIISVKKAPPPDYKEWKGKPDKHQYFSPNPG